MKAGGGSRIRNARFPTKGTLGCLVRRPSEPGSLFLLSAAHVIARNGMAVEGDGILWLHDGTETRIAEYDSFVRFRSDGAGQVCDAAIARITREDLVTAEIIGIGTPRGRSGLLYPGRPLRLHGAKSGLLEGLSVHAFRQSVPVIYSGSGPGTYRVQFDEQILYGRVGAGVQAATLGGDSGAVVVDSGRNVVGMHIAVTPRSYPVAASVCTPIQPILEALNVELVTEQGASGVTASGDRASAQGQAAMRGEPAGADTSLQDRASRLGLDQFGVPLGGLLEPHRFEDSVAWQLSEEGLLVAGERPVSPGRLVTVPRVWQAFGDLVQRVCAEAGVPVELAVATICTESRGDAQAVHREPGWTSNSQTPRRVSIGLMQTLISSAREALGDQTLTGDELLDPETSVRAGVAFIKNQRRRTDYDPPKVAAAYNAGDLYLNEGPTNRWKMRQFPIGTGVHVDRFVMWFNDCFRFFETLERHSVPTHSYYRVLRGLA